MTAARRPRSSGRGGGSPEPPVARAEGLAPGRGGGGESPEPGPGGSGIVKSRGKPGRGAAGRWTFLDVSTRKYTHAIHLYPARMHPEIARRLIARHAGSGDVVFDPFMGSGGVLLESMLRGNDAIGLDVNPFAVLLTKVKTTPIRKDLGAELGALLEKSARDRRSGRTRARCLPTGYDLGAWFKPSVLGELAVLKHNVGGIGDPDVADFFRICLSLTVRRSSYQRNGAWKIHRLPEAERAGFDPSPTEIFAAVSRANVGRMGALVAARPRGRAHPILGDSRDARSVLEGAPGIPDAGRIRLVVTSPPYGDHRTTVAYGQFSRHSGHWLDLPDGQVRRVDREGLGGRTRRDAGDLGSGALNRTLDEVRRNDARLTVGKTPSRAREVHAYFSDLDACMGQVSRTVASGRSRACFVVANRTVRRVVVPTDRILVELGKKHGFSLESTVRRDIPNKAMPSRNAPENAAGVTGSTMTREAVITMRC